MKRKGFIKARYLLFFSLLVVLLILPYKYLLAIPVVIQKDYTYQASELDSKVSCRAIALEQVKRLVLEEVGSHVISKTVVKTTKSTPIRSGPSQRERSRQRSSKKTGTG